MSGRISLTSLLTTQVPIGEALDLAGRLVTEPLRVERGRIASVDFRGARFLSPVVFRGSTFTGLSWFQDCVFEAEADFSDAIFGNDARFDRSRFASDAHFLRMEALGAADFSGAIFEKAVAFDGATFFGCLSFGHAALGARTSLRHAQCLGGLWMEGARAKPDAVDARGLDVHGRAWLRNLEQPLSSSLARSLNCYGYSWT